MSEHNHKPQNAEHTIHFLDTVGAPEALANPEARKDFILGLEYDDLKDWLVRINGMSRGVANASRFIDGDHEKRITTPDMLPPEAEDKEPLMELTLEAAKSILRSQENTEEALEGVSLLFSGVINYTHLFKDGNGRTSRVAGLVIREGYDGSDQSKQRLRAVMGYGGSQAMDTNPYDLTSWLDRQVVRENPPEGASVWPVAVRVQGQGKPDMSHLSEASQGKIAVILHDFSTADAALTATMIEHGLVPAEATFERGVLQLGKEDYLKGFTDETVDAAMEWSRKLRYERVATFIDAMQNPDHFKIHLTEHRDNAYGKERDTTLRGYYADFINANSELYDNQFSVKRQLAAAALANR